jgi:hypothetical protein
MQRVDGFYLYTVGFQVHPLSELRAYDMGPHQPATNYAQAQLPLYVAESALDVLVTRSIFRLRTSYQSGQNLLAAIRVLRVKIDADVAQKPTEKLTWFDVYAITEALRSFKAVLGAELSLIPLYVVAQKAGYDTSILIESGANCFPADVWTKAPEAIADLTARNEVYRL